MVVEPALSQRVSLVAAVQEAAVAPGDRVGQYLVGRCIGAGGMGAVFEAVHTGLDKKVALKTLQPGIARSHEARERFLREGRAAAQIRHPNVVDITDIGVADGVPFLVMEYLDGESLAARIERLGGMAPAEAVELLLPILSAVAAAHDANIVHRDLKPDNVCLVPGVHGAPVPKVIDFGLAKMREVSSLTGTKQLMGTPCYMAPEQLRSARDATPQSDQYALGVMLYECVTGRPPFEAETLFEIMLAITEGRFPAPGQVVHHLPPSFEAVVLRAMSRDPAMRFASIRELGAALLEFADDRTRRTWAREFAPSSSSTMLDENVLDLADTLPLAGRGHSAPTRGVSRKLLTSLTVSTLAALGSWAAITAIEGDSSPPARPETAPVAMEARSSDAPIDLASTFSPQSLVPASPVALRPAEERPVEPRVEAAASARPSEERPAGAASETENGATEKPARGSGRIEQHDTAHRGPPRRDPRAAQPESAADLRLLVVRNERRAAVEVMVQCGSHETRVRVAAGRTSTVSVGTGDCNRVACSGVGRPRCPPRLQNGESALVVR